MKEQRNRARGPDDTHWFRAVHALLVPLLLTRGQASIVGKIADAVGNAADAVGNYADAVGNAAGAVGNVAGAVGNAADAVGNANPAEVAGNVADTLDPNWPPSVSLKDGATFDYIVVGAGAAGAAAAARLALAGEDVLLLEAGGDPNLITRIPGAALALLGSPLDWQYKTVSNNVSCLSSEGRHCRFSRGKCLGGSTSINYMLYVRANPRDFDDLGIPGWTWNDMLPYFLRYEGLQSLRELPASSIPYHNTTGTMKIEFFSDSHNSWHSRVKEGFEALNFPVNYDVNAKSQIGVTQTIGYVHDGERMSTARGYLTRDDVRKTLKVAKNTKCIRVLLDADGTATGVVVEHGSPKRRLRLYARREVVLSAGTVGTAQILLLSGIGPADHLTSLGIPVRADLPVGEGISDHVLPLTFLQVDPGLTLNVPNIFLLGTKGVQAAQWLATRDGPLASNGITDVFAIANTLCYDTELRKLVNNSSDCELPTLQIINAYIDRNLIQGIGPIIQRATGLNRGVVDQLVEANAGQALIMASPVVLRPYSRGAIRLASADPSEPPEIFANYLGDERDVDEMLRSLTILEHLVETPAYAEHNASILKLKLPGCPDPEDRDGYWRCYCRHMTYSVYHAVGSARLGAVLDGSLRVRGVRSLRVADLSALPEVPRANTEAAAIAIGERVADFIINGS